MVRGSRKTPKTMVWCTTLNGDANFSAKNSRLDISYFLELLLFFFVSFFYRQQCCCFFKILFLVCDSLFTDNAEIKLESDSFLMLKYFCNTANKNVVCCARCKYCFCKLFAIELLLRLSK